MNINFSVKTIIRQIWTLFLSGFLTILPFALTLSILSILFKFVLNWLEPVRKIMSPALLGIPYAEVILAIFMVFFIGFLYNMVVLRPIVHLIEEAFLNTPLIKPLYMGIKQLVQAFSLQDKVTFRQVVIVEFPRQGIYSIGFLTSELPSSLTPNPDTEHFIVYVPTTPNPTSGFCIIVPKKDVHPIDLSRQEAMALIISGGIVRPDRFSMQK